MSRTVTLNDGTTLPAIGQGTWHMGEDPSLRQREVSALQAGIDAGLTLIDTAEMYADGEAERVVAEALRGRRARAWLVSKVYPWNAGEVDAVEACERSLQRLNTDYLDLYLLHWRGTIPLEETIVAMEGLIRQGKILRWGVSNFASEDLSELLAEEGGAACTTNQVLYHLGSRGIEYDLLPQCRQLAMPIMAYCPLAQAGGLRRELMSDPRLREIARQKGISVAQLLLAWSVRHHDVLAIPKAATQEHVAENRAALDIVLSVDELAMINMAFPPPHAAVPLDVV